LFNFRLYFILTYLNSLHKGYNNLIYILVTLIYFRQAKKEIYVVDTVVVLLLLELSE